ncbi:MAG: enoyl-CoA hydratase/isomerase family protein [Rhizobiales bacterium]|nr:enoyl-CoA hydratase/isomerase family protein [Hyphomicrobiales bacterium]
MSARVELAIGGAIATITFINPKRHNALNFSMWQALPGLIARAENDSAVRVVVLRGIGDDAFVSGADISEFTTLRAKGEPARRYEDANSRAFAAIRNCMKPTIALIHGFCIGGGFGIAAACDLRYADEAATFGVPAAKLGLSYPIEAMADIVNAIGASAAKELIYTAKTIDAAQAQQLGFINAVWPRRELDVKVHKIAICIADGAPLTVQAAKTAIAHSLNPSERSLAAAVESAGKCFGSEDYDEGVHAFLNKRKATFEGK